MPDTLLAVGVDLEATTRTVRELAAEQGRYVLSRWPAIGTLRYKDRRDVVTDVDETVERALIRELSARFPGHGFSGEETGDHHPDADYVWLIDPIDGTKYYVGQAGLFSVSIALLYRGEPVVGVVHHAASGQCFHAYRGGGAFVDDRRLAGPAVARLDEVVANVDTPETHRLSPAERRWFESRLVELSRRLYRLRAVGVGALATCWVASGALDAYVDLTGYSKPQDTAAGRLLMTEAGLRAEDVDVGVGPPRLVAAPPALFDGLREILEAGPEILSQAAGRLRLPENPP